MNTSFRAFDGPDDCNAMLTIRKESAVVDPQSTCEDIPTLENIQRSTKNSPSDRFLLMIIDDEIVGYAQMSWWIEADETWVYLHNEWVLPKYRTPKILHQFLDRIQKHLSNLAKLHGHIATATFATNASETEEYRSRLLLSSGYQAVWTMVEMEFTDFGSLELPDEPEGIAIRSPEEEQYHDIWNENNKIYSGTWGSVPINEADFRDFVARSLRNPELCSVATEGSQLAGFVLCFVQDDVGVIDEVTTVRTHQKQGIGNVLLSRSLVQIHRQGVDIVRLHTDANNGAGGRALYEKIGFEPVKLYRRYRKSMTM